MKTKNQIITAAINLITTHPQTAVSGYSYSPYKSAAETDYEFELAEEMESFTYSFSLTQFTLQNPVSILDDNGEVRTDLQSFTIPEDVSYPLAVLKESEIPDARTFIGSRGTKNIASYVYSVQENSSMLVQAPTDLEEALVLLYVTNNPAVERMSGSFKKGLRYAIGATLAQRYIQQRNVVHDYRAISKSSFQKAQKLSLYGQNTKFFTRTSVSDSVYTADVTGRDTNRVSNTGRLEDRYRNSRS